ncbi:UDP-N-acetylmuramoyl-L-alanyl-D-glutamate--2,6-diaminopimelate ligase [candidate division WOR-3 bacterium]|nr:UDP-N-acetylmuramoyl-L-alanyl-D-glutamate--2,6-diaminopimelate ligase [candidate division WOR-3 bacterium]
MTNIDEIKENFPELKIHGYRNENPCITGIGPDSRTLEKGDIFVVTDETSLKWIKDAVAKGAPAVLAREKVQAMIKVPVIECKNTENAALDLAQFIYKNEIKNLKIVGITGTNGKTTTAFMLKSIFEKAGLSTGMIGTTGHYFSNETEKAFNTTPPALEIYRLLGKMTKKRICHVVMEVSSHALELGRIKNLLFDSVLFTSFGQDHLDFHGSLENYFKAKLKIFTLMKENAFSCVNGEIVFKDSISKATDKSIYFYSAKEESDFRIIPEIQNLDSSRFRLVGRDCDFEIELHIPTRVNMFNAAGAAVCALKFGIDEETISNGLKRIREIPGRLQKVKSGAPFSIFVDFAHTPDALENLLSDLKNLEHKKIISVFGCGGDRDKLKRPEMGKIAEKYSDVVILTDDNPRSENPDLIIGEIMAGMTEKPLVFRDRKEAIRKAVEKAGVGDIVVICGKGHETYQITQNKVSEFNDREEVKKTLAEYGWIMN